MAKKVEVDFREVSAFITLCTPYRAGYAYKYKGRYWTTSRGFLKDELIQVAIDGKAVIGFKAMYRSAVLGLDVDDHEHGGWLKGRAAGPSVGEMTPELRDRVGRVKEAMGLEPSMAVRSTRGMHLFWFWIGPVFLSEATAITKKRLLEAGDDDLLKHVDILPQAKVVLRIPRRAWIIEPGTECTRLYDRRRNRDAHLNIDDFPIYDFEEFEEAEPIVYRSTGTSSAGGRSSAATAPEGTESADPSEAAILETGESEYSAELGSPPSTVSSSSSSPSASDHTMRAPTSRAEAERDVMPFRNHETNWQLGLMVIAGKHEGMTDDEIERWVTDWIGRSRSLGYTRDLGGNVKNLQLRIGTYGKKVRLRSISYKEIWEHVKDDVRVDAATVEEIINQIESTGEMRSRQRTYVRRFVGCLLGWMDGLDRIVPADTDLSERVKSLAGYRQFRRKEWYPLPTSLLRRWYDGYDQVIGWLVDIGVLVRRANYHPDKGIPRWYDIKPPRP
jgi:hypothetical protein